MKTPLVSPLIALFLFGSGCASSLGPVSMSQPAQSGDASSTALVFGSPTTTPSEWRQILSPEAYDVFWNKGTEAPSAARWIWKRVQGRM